MSIKRVYIHDEKSARCNAFIKHVTKYNSDYEIYFISNPNPNFFECKEGDVLFILNENAIIEYGEKYRNIMMSCGGMCIFPTQEQSILESSKVFCRQIIAENGLGKYNPEYYILNYEENNHNSSCDSSCDTNEHNILLKIGITHVIKADGLEGGKGVFVGGEHFNTNKEAIQIVNNLSRKHKKILIEEKLIGEEFSVISLCWNGKYCHFPCIKDFKRRNNGNTGPNTGGMGTISFPGGLMPFITMTEYEECCQINEKIAKATGGFTGFLYGSFMKTNNCLIKIIEYNVRPGDSEAVNMFEMLESSLLDYITGSRDGDLLINNREYTYFRYIVPENYPLDIRDNMDRDDMNCEDSSNNKEIKCDLVIIPRSIPDNVWYSANVNFEMKINGGDRICRMSKSRIGGIYTHNIDYKIAVANNNRYLEGILGNFHYRTDLGNYFANDIYSSTICKTKPMKPMNYLNHLSNYNHIITNTKAQIDLTNAEIEILRNDVKVIGKIGDFANSIEWLKGGSYAYTNKIDNGVRMICSVDGAGTKTKFLEGHPSRFHILGRDIVIHNLNDMYCQNGIPIALLDYYGCDKLDRIEFNQFIEGVLEVCREYCIPLIGGETAEMRGIFQSGEIEVLGILLGIIPEGISCQNGGEMIKRGSFIYGISSNGAHTNGFTKLRAIMDNGMPSNIREFFSQPHKCYIKIMEILIKVLGEYGISIVGKAHITGGGFVDNIERIFPDNNNSRMHIKLIDKELWEMSSEWWWVYEKSEMKWDDFLRVFNAGWGFCFITEKEIPQDILDMVLKQINMQNTNTYTNTDTNNNTIDKTEKNKIKLLGHVI